MLGPGDAAHEVLASDEPPSRSVVLPFELKLGERNTDTDESVSSKRIIRLFGMSDQIK